MKKRILLSALAALSFTSSAATAATQVDLVTPPGSGEFGRSVTVLPNGNFVVTDPGFDQISPAVSNIGAAYLYSPEGTLISRLTGRVAGDQVGRGGVFVLANGNFVVVSDLCDNGAINSAGAATWGSAVTGFRDGPDTVVSVSNSIMGGTANDNVGTTTFFFGSTTTERKGIIALTNGNYLVCTQSWDNPSPVAANVGAVTWCNGATGSAGLITSSNSLVGSTASDGVGDIITVLSNGNYVVGSPDWNNGAVTDAGAATWGSGTTGVSGIISSANSLVGASANDRASSNLIKALPNGNYVVLTTNWDNLIPVAANAGAATWGDGRVGITGFISAANSLVGTTAQDFVTANLSATTEGIIVLANSNYLILSPEWDNGAIVDAGAVTWGDGSKGISGAISETNSLVGNGAGHSVGGGNPVPLTNGNYVVVSRDVPGGAATWGDGTKGVTGPVTAQNSLVGALTGSSPGPERAVALANGHYVVQSPFWNNGGPTAIGAATWCDGTKVTRGLITPANSLVGSILNDRVGNLVVALTNGNYVVGSSVWDNEGTADVGAVTWANGRTGIKGLVSPANSLIGSNTSDFVGGTLTALTNGNYVVGSSAWDNEGIFNVGAATWGNGVTGTRGVVSPANSLVGTSEFDSVGGTIIALPNGNYLVQSNGWNNGAILDVGAVTWGNGTTGITGTVSAANSLVGTTAGDEVGFARATVLGSHYILNSSRWDAASLPLVDAGAITLGSADTGVTGLISRDNSFVGSVASPGFFGHPFAFDPLHNQLIVGHRLANLVTLFRGDRLRSLAKTSFDAPGALDIAHAKHGSAAVNADGLALFDSTLTGTGSSSGRNRGLFAHSPFDGSALVLQTGTALSLLGGALPSNATATAIQGQVFNRLNLGLFQATVKGTGITATNNRLLLLDNGANVQLLHRTGSLIGIGDLATASISTFTEVLQNHDQDIITVAYKLRQGGSINSSNDEGLLFLSHSGVIAPNLTAREGQTSYGIGGTFGAFTGRAASAQGSNIFFTAPFKPTGSTPISAVYCANLSGSANALLVASDAAAPSSGGATFSTFPAITHQSGKALVRATLKNSPASQNEGIYSLPTNVFDFRALLARKGDPIGGGLTISRILRFWPAGADQLLLHVQVTGTNVNPTNNQVLLLRQSDGAYLSLLRTGTPDPRLGIGNAKVASLSAVEVNPISGRYSMLATLSGAPASSNQALWTGDPALGDNSAALQILRLPRLTLRKGNRYTTDATPQGLIRSIALKPAADPTGAGGRGLAQALGELGDLAIFITTDRALTEVVLLDR